MCLTVRAGCACRRGESFERVRVPRCVAEGVLRVGVKATTVVFICFVYQFSV